VITPATGMFYVVQKKYRKVNREVKRIDSAYSGRFLTQLAETTSGVTIIRSFKKENYMVKDFLDRIRDNLLSRSIMETVKFLGKLRALPLIPLDVPMVCD